MGVTNFGYGSVWTAPFAIDSSTGSGTVILPALPQSRYEIDHIHASITSMDAGAMVKVGFGSDSASPAIAAYISSNINPYEQVFEQPGYGNYGVKNQAVTVTVTGNGVSGSIKLAYHLVPVTMIPASGQQSPGTQQ